MAEDLSQMFSKAGGEPELYMPRYFIYDGAKEKFYIDLPKPSTGKVLEQTILQILKE